VRGEGAVGLHEARSNSVNEGFHQESTCADCQIPDRGSGLLQGVTNITVEVANLQPSCSFAFSVTLIDRLYPFSIFVLSPNEKRSQTSNMCTVGSLSFHSINNSIEQVNSSSRGG
jgi:hypothetical protein